jgi:hypothetical protein
LPAAQEKGSFAQVQAVRTEARRTMEGPDAAPGLAEAAAHPQPPAPPWPHPWWLRDLPFAVLLVLTLSGVLYMSFAHRPMIGYWEVLAPVIGLVCIISGWPQAQDKAARIRLVWTQVLHWLAFLAAMNLLLLGAGQSMLTPDAAGLAVLTLLALGTFVAGVHLQTWQICLLGALMGISVPAIAWIQRSSLLLLIAAAVLIAIGVAYWWTLPRRRA